MESYYTEIPATKAILEHMEIIKNQNYLERLDIF